MCIRDRHYSESSAALGNYHTLDLALLKNEPFIGLKKIQKFSALGLRLCEEAGFSPNTICETLNWETVHMMIASGLGVGFVPKILIGSIQDEKICPCYYRLPSNVYRVYALVPVSYTHLDVYKRQPRPLSLHPEAPDR